MQSRALGLVACRLCALLFAAIGTAASAIGALALCWAVFGQPGDFDLQLEDDLPEQARFLMVMLGAIAAAVGLFHATLSVPAALGRIWPLVAGTLGWALVAGPLLGRMAPEALLLPVALPVVFAALTLTALLAKRRAQRTAHASSSLRRVRPTGVSGLDKARAGVDYAGGSCHTAGAVTGARTDVQ